MDWTRFINKQQTKLETDDCRSSVPIHRTLFRTRSSDSHDNTERNHRPKRHRKYKHILKLILGLSLLPSPSFATDVGGVSATANPVANSSGSVTNQAIQVLQGPYITNTYGNGIQCQGPTMNVTPYATFTASAQKPYEAWWDSPVYNMIDANDDGVPDNPGEILYFTPNRTGQKDNYNVGLGISATWSKPLDKELQQQCKDAASANIALMQQAHANKRLDFEIARLKNCGELLKQGISFHPNSPYYAICADVMVNGKNVITPHVHDIQPTSFSTSSESLTDLTLSIGDID